MTSPASPDTEAPARAPRIYTIPPGRPFLKTLARALLDGQLPLPTGRPRSPVELAGITLLLPTRRATRAVQEAFLEVAQGRALLLPRIAPVAEGEEDLSLLAALADATPPLTSDAFEIPPAAGELERRLVLTRLVMQWSNAMRSGLTDAGDEALAPYAAAGAQTPAQAANLARELARLVDMVETENVSLAGLSGLVGDEFAEHWRKTLDFLKIVVEWWPAHLAASGTISPMERRNRLILAEAARLRRTRPTAPMIVAGVTGSIPATVELMRAVAGLDQGAIVLPGVDLDLDEESWQAITSGGQAGRPHAEHPQFGLKTLLDRLGVSRADIVQLGGPESPSAAARARLVSEAMRPSSTTARWARFAAGADRAACAAAVDSLTLIEAPSPADEAEAIALIMREVAETPDRTAALVSPDRLLARRVAIRLEAWGIRVDDSAGRPFPKTVPGTVLDLAIEAAATDFAPAPTIALVKHPLVRLGLDPFSIRRAARYLELAAFRGPYIGNGIDGIRSALTAAEDDCDDKSGETRRGRRHKAVQRLFPADWVAARDLIDRLENAMAPLLDAFGKSGRQPLAALAAAHVATAEALCAEPPADASDDDDASTTGGAAEEADTLASPLWQGEAGLAARTLFDALAEPGLTAPDLAARDYPDFYRTLVATENVRPRVPVHPRLSIWGPFEARLQQRDVMILGSLNDGTWPESADPGPWLNRPMRASLGLPSPEERIGYAAHDYTQLVAGPTVVLTRATKVDGVPAVPSRWLMRLEAVLGSLGLGGALKAPRPAAPYLAWARQRDAISRRERIGPPKPCPPLEARPRRMSVSAIERWMANPYAIYASHILRLEPLPMIGEDPGPAIRGNTIHEALARFSMRYPTALPADIETALLDEARAVLVEWTGHPRVAAFWLPRLERFARWFAETEPARRQPGGSVVAEVNGRTDVGPPEAAFTLTARADRIDVTPAGIVITDYKSGAPPRPSLVVDGYRPQLPLEAAIAATGGFGKREGVASTVVTGLRFIGASGGEPPGVEVPIDGDPAEIARSALDGLARLIARFDDPATPYAVLRRRNFSYDYDDFAHLARVAEWSAADGGADGEGSA